MNRIMAHMKVISVSELFLIILLSTACSDSNYLDVTGPGFYKSNNITYLKDSPFTGNGYEIHELWGSTFFGQYVNGLKQGEWNSYFDDGSVMFILNYKDGVEAGRFINYYSKDIPMLEGYYLNGLENGKWILYYESGQILSTSTFVNGKREGKREEFNRDGSRWFTKFYKNGIEIGCEGDCSSDSD